MTKSTISTPLELFNLLYVPFPDAVKTTKHMGDKKGTLTFVEWYHYVARAWKQFPKGFSKEITKLLVAGEALILVVRITDEATGLYQESTGSASVNKGSSNFGGAAAEAEHQATKRAFAHFGMGLEMYMDQEDNEQVEGEAPTKASQEQIDRMVQLIGLVPDTEETADLQYFISTLRAMVTDATDKAFHTGIAIEQLEERLIAEGMELPDPF